MKKKRGKGLSKPRKSRVQTAVSSVSQAIFMAVFIAGLGGLILTARALGIFFKS